MVVLYCIVSDVIFVQNVSLDPSFGGMSSIPVCTSYTSHLATVSLAPESSPPGYSQPCSWAFATWLQLALFLGLRHLATVSLAPGPSLPGYS